MRDMDQVLVLALLSLTSSPTGVWLHADLGGGVIDGDPVAATSLGVGFEHEAFAVHLRGQLAARIVDLEPTVSPALPPLCRVIRCEEWLDGGKPSAAALSRILDEARVFHPGDAFHLRAGRLFATIGHGVLVDGYTNAADWDRRKSGAYAEVNLPWGRTQSQALVGNVLAPQEMFAARIATHPLTSPDESDALDRFFGRGRVAFEIAGDAVAPVGNATDAFGDIVPGSPSRPLLAGAAELAWPLLDQGALQIEPWIAVTSVYGLTPQADAVPLPLSTLVGLVTTFDAAFVAVRVGARAFLDGYAQRNAIFHTLYDVDRRRVLRADGTFAPFGFIDEPAVGGVGGDFDVELILLRIAKLGARARADSTPQGNFLESWAAVDLDALRAAARIRQRTHDLFAWGDRTLAVVEASWLVLPPFAIEGRWLHGPRFTPPDGAPVADDDVFIGVSLNVVLEPA